jgi:hypothetical protein
MKNTLYDGIDQLRSAVRLFDNCNESFNQRFTGEELLTLWRMYRECGWDIPPDDWAPRQIEEALEHNAPPRWDDSERPLYDDSSEESKTVRP